MKSNKIMNLIFILLIIFVTLLSFNSTVYAVMDAASDPGKFKPDPVENEKQLEEKIGVILGVINVAGVVVSVITLMCIGIKYMLGSVEEKAEYKKTMGMYLIGAFLVFSITTLPNILYKFSSNISNT